MVIRTIHKLRERPRDERAAVAGGISVAVVGVLLVGWVGFALHGIGSGEVMSTNPQPQSQQAASVSPATSQWHSTVATSSDSEIPSTASQP